jgi:predicted Zn-dependent protease
MRKAFLACALEHLDEGDDAAKEWADAVSSARGRADAMERLARFATQAKWPKRAQDIKWALTAMPQSPRWVADSLWQDAYQRGDTAQLQKLSSSQAKADPKGIAARNNYAFLSLLTRNYEGNPHGIAEALFREHPEDGMIASTYALSLYQQGKAADAVALMSALKPDQLRQPQVALYHAIFLLANGQAGQAQGYLKLSDRWPMLPEEKAMLDRAKAASAKTTEPAQPPPKTDSPAPAR